MTKGEHKTKGGLLKFFSKLVKRKAKDKGAAVEGQSQSAHTHNSKESAQANTSGNRPESSTQKPGRRKERPPSSSSSSLSRTSPCSAGSASVHTSGPPVAAGASSGSSRTSQNQDRARAVTAEREPNRHRKSHQDSTKNSSPVSHVKGCCRLPPTRSADDLRKHWLDRRYSQDDDDGDLCRQPTGSQRDRRRSSGDGTPGGLHRSAEDIAKEWTDKRLADSINGRSRSKGDALCESSWSRNQTESFQSSTASSPSRGKGVDFAIRQLRKEPKPAIGLVNKSSCGTASGDRHGNPAQIRYYSALPTPMQDVRLGGGAYHSVPARTPRNRHEPVCHPKSEPGGPVSRTPPEQRSSRSPPDEAACTGPGKLDQPIRKRTRKRNRPELPSVTAVASCPKLPTVKHATKIPLQPDADRMSQIIGSSGFQSVACSRALQQEAGVSGQPSSHSEWNASHPTENLGGAMGSSAPGLDLELKKTKIGRSDLESKTSPAQTAPNARKLPRVISSEPDSLQRFYISDDDSQPITRRLPPGSSETKPPSPKVLQSCVGVDSNSFSPPPILSNIVHALPKSALALASLPQESVSPNIGHSDLNLNEFQMVNADAPVNGDVQPSIPPVIHYHLTIHNCDGLNIHVNTADNVPSAIQEDESGAVRRLSWVQGQWNDTNPSNKDVHDEDDQGPCRGLPVTNPSQVHSDHNAVQAVSDVPYRGSFNHYVPDTTDMVADTPKKDTSRNKLLSGSTRVNNKPKWPGKTCVDTVEDVSGNNASSLLSRVRFPWHRRSDRAQSRGKAPVTTSQCSSDSPTSKTGSTQTEMPTLSTSAPVKSAQASSDTSTQTTGTLERRNKKELSSFNRTVDIDTSVSTGVDQNSERRTTSSGASRQSSILKDKTNEQTKPVACVAPCRRITTSPQLPPHPTPANNTNPVTAVTIPNNSTTLGNQNPEGHVSQSSTGRIPMMPYLVPTDGRLTEALSLSTLSLASWNPSLSLSDLSLDTITVSPPGTPPPSTRSHHAPREVQESQTSMVGDTRPGHRGRIEEAHRSASSARHGPNEESNERALRSSARSRDRNDSATTSAAPSRRHSSMNTGTSVARHATDFMQRIGETIPERFLGHTAELAGVPGVLIVSVRRGRLQVYLSRERPNVEGVVRYMYQRGIHRWEYDCEILPWRFRNGRGNLPLSALPLVSSRC